MMPVPASKQREALEFIIRLTRSSAGGVRATTGLLK